MPSSQSFKLSCRGAVGDEGISARQCGKKNNVIARTSFFIMSSYGLTIGSRQIKKIRPGLPACACNDNKKYNVLKIY